MRQNRVYACMLTVMMCLMSGASFTWAHGFAGKRFFPSTLNVDDPFMNDELSITFNHLRGPAAGANPATASALGLDYSKTIVKHIGFSVGGTLLNQNSQFGNTQTGFDNVDVGVKYQFFTSGAHEAIVAVGSTFKLANTGQARVGARSFTTFSPTLYFGKGFGDLPYSMGLLKPFVITGTLAANIPSRASTTTGGTVLNPTSISWGLTLQYEIQYLQSFVKYVGIPAPFSNMIPIVEFAFNNEINQGSRLTTGTINPGVLWIGKTMELGAEAQIPANPQSGSGVGFSLLVHFFIDDLFPYTLGHPLFGD